MTPENSRTATGTWTGQWVARRLGIHVSTAESPVGLEVRDLVGLALRRNPRRAHLVVSTVLGKHVPTDPRLVRAAGLVLGGLVADCLAGRSAQVPDSIRTGFRNALDGDGAAVAALRTAVVGHGERAPYPSSALVLGYAETATALGHCVADCLPRADYLHSTRRPGSGAAAGGTFQEEHSHATDHLLLPVNPDLLPRDRPLVLVDDELSTGTTVSNTIRALHRSAPRQRYVVATLVDLRPAEQVDALVRAVADLGANLEVVSLACGGIELPPDLHERCRELVAELTAPEPALPPTAPPRGSGRRARRIDLGRAGWPQGLPEGGRHGFTPADRERMAQALPELARAVAAAAGLAPGHRVLVVGTEELMYLPLRLAEVLADSNPGTTVSFSTTTRSPALSVPAEDYALGTCLTFPAHDDPVDGPGLRYAYNLVRVAAALWDAILVVVDEPGDTDALHAAGGLLARLAPLTRRTLLVVCPTVVDLGAPAPTGCDAHPARWRSP